jgi:hypothetical protein
MQPAGTNAWGDALHLAAWVARGTWPPPCWRSRCYGARPRSRPWVNFCARGSVTRLAAATAAATCAGRVRSRAAQCYRYAARSLAPGAAANDRERMMPRSRRSDPATSPGVKATRRCRRAAGHRWSGSRYGAAQPRLLARAPDRRTGDPADELPWACKRQGAGGRVEQFQIAVAERRLGARIRGAPR